MKRMQVKKSATQLRGGFTLTELLIVMAILVLLVSMVGPRLLGSKAKADINAVKTQIGMFQSALERYAIDMNRFPTTEQSLKALIAVPSSDGSLDGGDDFGGESEEDMELEDEAGGEGGSSSNWDGPYIKTETLPKDPWGNSYRYEFPATHNRLNVPDIWSLGPDGQEDTEDDIVSWTGKGTNEDGDLGGDLGEDLTES